MIKVQLRHTVNAGSWLQSLFTNSQNNLNFKFLQRRPLKTLSYKKDLQEPSEWICFLLVLVRLCMEPFRFQSSKRCLQGWLSLFDDYFQESLQVIGAAEVQMNQSFLFGCFWGADMKLDAAAPERKSSLLLRWLWSMKTFIFKGINTDCAQLKFTPTLAINSYLMRKIK